MPTKKPLFSFPHFQATIANNSKMAHGRKSALTCLSLTAVLFAASQFQTSDAFTPGLAHKTSAMKVTTLFSQRASTECPEIPTTARNPTNEVAVLASGWFWHPQRDFRALGGVVDVVVGYTGGNQKNPTYKNIMDATEAFLVEFDPSVISYEKILDEVSFWLFICCVASIICLTLVLCTVSPVGCTTRTFLSKQMSIQIGHLVLQWRTAGDSKQQDPTAWK